MNGGRCVCTLLKPKSSGLNTDDRAPRTYLCALNLSPATWKLEHDISAIFGREKSAEMLVQVRWRHHDQRCGRICSLLLNAELHWNHKVAPEAEPAVHEVLRLFQPRLIDEIMKADASKAGEVHQPRGPRVQRHRHRLPRDIQQLSVTRPSTDSTLDLQPGSHRCSTETAVKSTKSSVLSLG